MKVKAKRECKSKHVLLQLLIMLGNLDLQLPDSHLSQTQLIPHQLEGLLHSGQLIHRLLPPQFSFGRKALSVVSTFFSDLQLHTEHVTLLSLRSQLVLQLLHLRPTARQQPHVLV